MSDEYDEEYNDDKNADQNAWMYVCDEESRLVYSLMIEIRAASHPIFFAIVICRTFFMCGWSITIWFTY